MKLFKLLLAALPLLSLASAQKISLKVNLGGGPAGDFLGEEQVLDMSGFSKNVAREPIQNTDQPEVFQSQRFARGSDMTIRIPVPDGIYSVTLLFAETFRPACVPGARVFDISLGTPVSGVSKIVDKFDVFQSAGCASAHGKRFDNVPSKEGIVVHLSQIAQHPSLAGFIVEGFPQPKGNGQEYKAIARAEPDPMMGGVPGDAPAGAAPTAPLAMEAAPGAGTPGMGAAPMGGEASSMSASMPGAEHQGAPGSMNGMGISAPPPDMNPGFQGGMPMGGAQPPMVGAQPPIGGTQTPMDAGQQQMPIGGVQPPFRGRRRLLSHGDGEEEIFAVYHDIPLPYIGIRGRGYSRGLKGLPVQADKVRLGKDPDLALDD